MPSISQPFALLMDSLAAKDLACLLGGYCKLLVDPSLNVFRMGRPKVRVHRISAEEGVFEKFTVVEGVCYESLASEQKLFSVITLLTLIISKRGLFQNWRTISLPHIKFQIIHSKNTETGACCVNRSCPEKTAPTTALGK